MPRSWAALPSALLVSILVLVDLAHEFIKVSRSRNGDTVSILVLVDLAHEYENSKESCTKSVSILVLVDLAHESG